MAEEQAQQQLTVKREPRALVKSGFTFLPQTWEELFAYAKEISNTDFVPKTMQGKPGAVLAAWQTGQEVGLPPMASLQSIAIINGRPSIHSNGFWALITSHPLCEWFAETAPDEALKQGYGECTIKRRGNPHAITRRFSIEEAKTANLWGKDNWKNYPGDMLQNRARHRAGDDAIPEATQGLLPSDVARDLDPIDVTPAKEPALRIPQPLPEKEKAVEDIKPQQKASEDSGATGPERAEPVSETSHGSGPENQVPDSTKPKSKVELALERIAGFSAETFPPIGELRVYTDGMNVNQLKIVSDAYAGKKRQLGLDK